MMSCSASSGYITSMHLCLSLHEFVPGSCHSCTSVTVQCCLGRGLVDTKLCRCSCRRCTSCSSAALTGTLCNFTVRATCLQVLAFMLTHTTCCLKSTLPEAALPQHAGFCVSPPMLVLEFMEVRIEITMLLSFCIQSASRGHM